MKALSVRQPWAHFISTGDKTIEIRTWTTRHRGPLAIVASKSLSREGLERLDVREPRGVVLCVVDLLDVRPWQERDEYRALSDGAGSFSWVLRLLYRTEHVPTLGRLSLFDIPDPPRAS